MLMAAEARKGSIDSYDEDSATQTVHSPLQNEGHDATSPGGSTSGTSPLGLPKVPPSMPKRRRVTRACDECRRKKIKCDGKRPCQHCTAYSYDCTFDQPSNRRRNPASQNYIQALETRLRRAEAILRTVLPHVDLNDSDLDTEGLERLPVLEGRPVPAGETCADGTDNEQRTGSGEESDALLESMVETTGQLDLDDSGNWDFHGHSSGLAFLRLMQEQYGDVFGLEDTVLMVPKPQPMLHSPTHGNVAQIPSLPAEAVARGLVSNSLDDACAIMLFVHKPTFWASFDRIYALSPDDYTVEDRRFLPLLYSVLALGCLFAKTEQSDLEKEGYAIAIRQGTEYFQACRQLLDITDCRDLTSLQAVVFMMLFLQSSARLSTCYSYIGIAMASALRMGLHRSLPAHFNLIERETRKRVFWLIRRVDVYVGALLGLPKTLADEDIDQDYAMEVDDEYITEDVILPMPEGKISLMAAANAHLRLTRILAKVIKYVYPIKGIKRSANARTVQSYVVSYARIKEIQEDMQEWMDQLPMQLRIGGEASSALLRVQQLLRIYYAHLQMILYKPFLHYLSRPSSAGRMDNRSYACAAASISVSRNVIHITSEMKKRGLLIGSYWFIMYTTFFAILSLVFFVLENPDDSGVMDTLRDAEEGHDTLRSLSKRSLAADNCNAYLSHLFDQLPEKLRTRGKPTTTTHKRHAPSPLIPHLQSTKSDHELTKASTESVPPVQRSSTYPIQSSTSPRAPTQVDQRIQHSNTGLESKYQRAPSTIYTPPELSTVSTPEPPTKPAPLLQEQFIAQQQQQQFPLQNTVPDVSAMMFPSTDPFAYPNNPITILEDWQYKQGPTQSVPDASMFNSEAENLSNGGNNLYDALEVQLLGPLPPYLMQAQQLGPSPGYPLQPAINLDLGAAGDGLYPPLDQGPLAGDAPMQQQQNPKSTRLFQNPADWAYRDMSAMQQ